MKQAQRGFTLIELVMVIVILGVLAAVAIPKFVDLKSDAVTASTQGVAGALSSAAAINYASRSISTSKGSAVTTCANGVGGPDGPLQGGLPTGYTTSGGAVGAGLSVVCTLTNAGPPSTTASFTAIGIL
jgi:MSHA pilin protein MshA